MREDGMMSEAPSQVRVVGTREEVTRSWLESEQRTLGMLAARLADATRAGREREAAKLREEFNARTTKYEQAKKEMEA